MATTYILSRKLYASQAVNRDVAAEENNYNLPESVEDINPYNLTTADRVKYMKEKLEKTKSPEKIKPMSLDKLKKASEELSKLNQDKTKTRNKTINQNININRNTITTNPSKEKEVQANSQLQMMKLQDKTSGGNGVNEKLIELQKTTPLKPLSINGGN